MKHKFDNPDLNALQDIMNAEKRDAIAGSFFLGFVIGIITAIILVALSK